MPDEKIMVQIRALEEQRAWSALDELVQEQTSTGDESTGLHHALAALAENCRATADLYERAKLKGAKTAHIDPLRTTAHQLDVVIKQLEQPRRAPLGQLQPASAPPADAPHLSAGLDEAPHRFTVGPGSSGATCTAMVERDGHGDQCGRFASHPAHRIVDAPDVRPSLDALIADATGKAAGMAQRLNGLVDHGTDPMPPPEGAALGVTDDQRADHDKAQADMIDDVVAYLSGEVDDIPAASPRALVPAHDMTPPESETTFTVTLGSDIAPAMLPFTTARETLTTMDPAHAIPPVPLLGQPGDAGRGYDHSYRPEGGVPLTFAELMTPVPYAALPAHLSHSQIDTLADCPTKYRAQRIGWRPDPIALPPQEIPQWANIGGSAFHAAAEAIERWLSGESVALLAPVADRSPTLVDAESLWRAAFEAECRKVEASSPVPRSRWRAASKGAEGETWWNANGPEMLKRYLAARPDQPTLQFSMGGPSGTAIEWEVDVLVPTPYGPLPYKAIIDRVTWDERRGAYVIRDYKTGRMPEDTSQLGEYANALRLAGLVFPDAKIYGTLFNARKGEWTPEVDLDEAWPAEWFAWRGASGHANKLALTQGPTPARPSSYCGGCAVRWACPIKNAGAKR